MSEASERYAAVAAAFSARVAGAAEARWDAPSPCSEWSARDVVTHVVDTHGRVLASLGPDAPAVAGSDDALPARLSAVTAAVQSALADPATASKTIGGMFGEQPFESLVGRLLCADTLIHTWDLARATGQDERLEASAVAAALAFLTPLDDSIRRPGGFGPKLEPPPDADEQTRLLSFCGRAV